MRKHFSETLTALFDCVNRINESQNLTSQQQNDLQNIKSLGANLRDHCNRLDREINSLRQNIKSSNQSEASLDSQNEDEIYTLLALMFARLRQSINVDELLEAVAFETHQIIQSDQVIVYQLADSSNQSTIKYESISESNRSLLGQNIPSIYIDPVWLEAYQSCISQVIDDLSSPNIASKISEVLIPLGVRSVIAVGIPRGKDLWGIIIVHQYESSRYWEDWEIELLEKVATQLAILIHQMQMLVKSESIRLERDLISAELQHSQLHDVLTGLPNRDSFMKSLDLAFTKLEADSNCNYAVLFIDCDRFKSINDNFGMSTGDILLQEISQRLNVYRANNITIARIDSDEFAILVENIDRKDSVVNFADQLIESIKQPYIINDNQIFISISIGISISDPTYLYANETLRYANIAMHNARRLGRGKYALFSLDMNQGIKVRWQLETDLRYALERQEFHLVYQPIVSLHQHSLSGFEALLRWEHSSQGLISPLEFLPIAEATGDIIEIGYWVLETACKQLKSWSQEFPNNPPLTIGINVSTLQVIQPDFVERIQQIISEQEILPSSIKLEITESMLMENIEVSSAKLEQLREIGVQVYIDDFGTGFSSFSYLQNLPIDVLKIDRSFTNRVSNDIKSQRIIQSILRLANTLGMGVVVEGVETAEELDYFESSGGSSIEVQGYFISHPLKMEKATQWIRANVLT